MYSDEKMEDEDNQDNSEKILDFIEEDRDFERRILRQKGCLVQRTTSRSPKLEEGTLTEERNKKQQMRTQQKPFGDQKECRSLRFECTEKKKCRVRIGWCSFF